MAVSGSLTVSEAVSVAVSVAETESVTVSQTPAESVAVPGTVAVSVSEPEAGVRSGASHHAAHLLRSRSGGVSSVVFILEEIASGGGAVKGEPSAASRPLTAPPPEAGGIA